MSLYNWAKRRSFEYTPVVLTEKDIIIADDNDEVLRKIARVRSGISPLFPTLIVIANKTMRKPRKDGKRECLYFVFAILWSLQKAF
jgi:hypothetical protein